MFMRNKWAWLLLGGFCAASAQDSSVPSGSLKIDFPNDSPVAVVKSDWGQSRADARGGAMVLDLHSALTLRNTTQHRIRGITLLVQSQEVTPGGKGSVSVASLDVHPGETFPVRIDVRLLRPLLGAGGPLAQISLDGVLFEDLSFYGPDRLNSRRSMTVWELEARRDRRYLKSILEAKGPEGLRQEILEAMARLSDRGTEASLTIIGEGTERAALEAQVARLGLQNRVEFAAR